MIQQIKENIKWFIDKDKIKEQMNIDTHKIDVQKTEIAKLKHYKEKNQLLKEEIKKLKQKLKERK